MNSRRLLVLSLGFFLSSCAAAEVTPMHGGEIRVCDVRNYGAVADDEAEDTQAIQAAINACAGRGGQVWLSAGTWRSGTIELGSDMTFTLGPGAILAAIPDIDLFPLKYDDQVDPGITGAGDGYHDYRAFIYARDVQNLTVEGPGILDGQGELFWDENFYDLGIPRPTLPRPQQMMELSECSNVTVRDITLRRAPAYSVRFNRCDRVRAIDVTVRNDQRSPNTDGIQIRDTTNAFITRADIDTGDDGIVIKSHLRAVDNLIVTDSVIRSDDGAIKFGTSGHVGVFNSVFSDILIRDSKFGIALFQMDGGSYLNNVFDNITIETGGRTQRTFAVYADIDKRTDTSPWGRIEGLTLTGFDIRTAGNVLIAGNVDAPIRDLTLRDWSLTTYETVEALTPGRRKPKGNAYVKSGDQSENYAGEAANITLANIEDLTIEGLRVRHEAVENPRRAVWLKRVLGGTVSGLNTASKALSDLPIIGIEDSGDVAISNVNLVTDAHLFLEVTGDYGGPLRVLSSDLSKAEALFQLPSDVALKTSGLLHD
ncbi:MAG: glycosyl hydrolase family 28 protein [Henriciella sp.]|nr:glycosyl hydrolase family 28 protein [Henriciella sp.]